MRTKSLHLLFFGFIFHLAVYGQQHNSTFDPFLGTNKINSETLLSEKSPNPSGSFLNASAFPCDCETDFFTVDLNGAIQMWTVSNNTIVGGDTVLLTGDRGGLALCGPDPNNPTFFCSNSLSNTFMYYNPNTTNWTYITAPFTPPSNNGGFEGHQYYMEGLDRLYYYDGFNFSLVPGQNDRIRVADVAVDTLGQAWVFTGQATAPIATELRVYNPSGLVASYPVNINTDFYYGLFFLNNVLHIARGHTEDIIPIIISGGAVTFGMPKSFPPLPQNVFYADAASCRCSNEPPPCSDLSPVMTIVPGNVSGVSQVDVVVKVTELNDADTEPQPIIVRIPADQRLTFPWDPSLTTVGFTPVQNANWNYNGNNPLFHSWVYNGPNLIIQGGTTSAFGFNGTYDPQSTNGSTTITVTVIPFSGGECTIINNVDSEQLIYFD